MNKKIFHSMKEINEYYFSNEIDCPMCDGKKTIHPKIDGKEIIDVLILCPKCGGWGRIKKKELSNG